MNLAEKPRSLLLEFVYRRQNSQRVYSVRVALLVQLHLGPTKPFLQKLTSLGDVRHKLTFVFCFIAYCLFLRRFLRFSYLCYFSYRLCTTTLGKRIPSLLLEKIANLPSFYFPFIHPVFFHASLSARLQVYNCCSQTTATCQLLNAS